MDALAACVALGASRQKFGFGRASLTALCFGFFQAAMPIIGWTLGVVGTNIISSVDHWIAFILLGCIGGKMIYDSVKDRRSQTRGVIRSKPPNDGFKYILLLCVATSIDALATGIILPSVIGANTVLLMSLAVLVIGVITFVISFAGIMLGCKFGSGLSSSAEIVGGVVLILIGVKILVEHLISHP